MPGSRSEPEELGAISAVPPVAASTVGVSISTAPPTIIANRGSTSGGGGGYGGSHAAYHCLVGGSRSPKRQMSPAQSPSRSAHSPKRLSPAQSPQRAPSSTALSPRPLNSNALHAAYFSSTSGPGRPPSSSGSGWEFGSDPGATAASLQAPWRNDSQGNLLYQDQPQHQQQQRSPLPDNQLASTAIPSNLVRFNLSPAAAGIVAAVQRESVSSSSSSSDQPSTHQQHQQQMHRYQAGKLSGRHGPSPASFSNARDIPHGGDFEAHPSLLHPQRSLSEKSDGGENSIGYLDLVTDARPTGGLYGNAGNGDIAGEENDDDDKDDAVFQSSNVDNPEASTADAPQQPLSMHPLSPSSSSTRQTTATAMDVANRAMAPSIHTAMTTTNTAQDFRPPRPPGNENKEVKSPVLGLHFPFPWLITKA